MTDLLERYASLIDDPGAFAAALERPLPACVWVNRERLTAAQLEAMLAAGGLGAQPLPWYPGAYRLEGQGLVGNRFEYLAGLYYVQEEVSLLPVHLLDPQPGERILDLCAAPGNKTAQISQRIGRAGTVVANDRNLDRIAILRHNLSRLGALNVATTVQDATGYPTAAGLFDRILADVPCSCEGTSRKFPGFQDRSRPMVPGKLAGLQAGILRKAVQLCRPGGRIVYSTCTFAPEENEAVVDEILRFFDPGTLRLLPARIENFRSAPGIPSWQGQSYHPDLERALRAWPHHNDTGGFFVAVLEKVAETGRPVLDQPVPPPLLEDPSFFEALAERYALPATTFQGLGVTEPGRRLLSLVPTTLRLPQRPEPFTAGLAFLYHRMEQPKLSSAAAMVLAPDARANAVDLNEAQTDAYFHRQPISPEAGQIQGCDAPGPILVRHRGHGLGAGGLRSQDGAASLTSLYPKGWALAPDRSAFESPETDRDSPIPRGAQADTIP